MTLKDSYKTLSAKDFYYDLPNDKIAYHPLENRDDSKLLVYKNDTIIDDVFKNFVYFMDEKVCIVFNQSKVINARLKFFKESGAIIELFCIKPFHLEQNDFNRVLMSRHIAYWECLVGGKKKWKNKTEPIYIDLENKNTLKAFIHEEKEESTVIRFEWDSEFTFNELLVQYGLTPLPPYIKRNTDEEDKERYQTVFGNQYGSVAAPTASLHFTPKILLELKEKNITTSYLTLHVGAGTFLPMKDEWVHAHLMHEELIECTLECIESLITAKKNEKKILAVGTTSCRTLESLYWLGVKLITNTGIQWEGIGLKQWEAYELPSDISALDALYALKFFLLENNKQSILTQTQILIVPGYEFKLVDILQTNFHQPESTLLMLVSAFLGFDTIKKLYNHALENDYRFLSYGDCTLLFK